MTTKIGFCILHAALAVGAIAFSMAISAQAQTENVLYTLTGENGGEHPLAGLTFDSAGNLYGTTYDGGDSPNCPNGCGTVFRLSPTGSGHWRKTVLHYFSGGMDGSFPASSLVFDAAGNLYGATLYGGGNSGCNGGTEGCGIIFKLAPATSGVWKETILYDFAGGADGSQPNGVIFDGAGNLYGSAAEGGKVNDCPKLNLNGCGLVFRLTHTAQGGWRKSALYTFSGYRDGAIPTGNVAFDSSGNLYAITSFGGTGCIPGGCGVVVKLSPASSGQWQETTLYEFTGGLDGGIPFNAPTLDALGNIYGANSSGGGNGWGTVFEISPTSSGAWTEATIHNFDAAVDGDNTSPLIFDSAGNLYAENTSDGPSGCGTAFELSPSTGGWDETMLLAFVCGAEGDYPVGGLILDGHGNLYGAARNESNLSGVVFSINP